VESYERHKKEGAVTIGVYGTPQIYALAAKLTEDRIPGRPRASAAPPPPTAALSLHLPHRRHLLVAGAAAVDFAKKQLGGLKGKKIAYIFFDNPDRP
jgi:branched-chain amino acid transport system substrate-binding protein